MRNLLRKRALLGGLLILAVTAFTTSSVFAASTDFDGDGNSDILWANSTGKATIWLMNGSARTSTTNIGSPGADWRISGVGDFDGDGKADVLWYNQTTGQALVWLMNGTTRKGSGIPGKLSTDWSILGVADFDADGKADILWYNQSTGQASIWLMNGTVKKSSGTIGKLGSQWRIEGVGDFDGDHRADILWRDDLTGKNQIWFMNGLVRDSFTIFAGMNSGWSVQAVADFDGDGKSDILWQDIGTGQTEIWLLNGALVKSKAVAGKILSGWSIQGVGNFHGNDEADILLRNSSTGQDSIWLMSGTSKVGSANPGIFAVTFQIAPLAPYDCSEAVLCNILTASNDVRANGPFGDPASNNPTPSMTPGGALDPFIWSVSARSNASAWAAQCNFGHNPDLDSTYGENIYAAGSTATPVVVTGTDAVDSWASEDTNYTYSDNSCAAGQTCGHYTQLVWRNTTAIGCAVQQCTTNSPFGNSFPDWAFVVCDFVPPGNFDNEAPY